MKIALLWPSYWPYIRRGTERMVHDIAQYLAGQGHEVHILTTKPGGTAVTKDGPVTVFRLGQIDHPLFIRQRWVPRFDTHGLQVLPLLWRGRYDLVHCFFYSYAPSVRLLRAVQGTPYIYHVVSIPPAWNRAMDAWLLDRILGGAAAVRVFSRWCADYVRQHQGIEAAVLPPTVDTERFYPCAERDLEHPGILFTGDLAEERKGAHLLVEAFNRLHRRHPETRLILAGPGGFNVEERVLRRIDPTARPAVLIPGPGTLASLPGTYATAAMTVLPSTGEPFGMVYTESLACGTPAVGARSGAVPEILTDPAVGTLFELGAREADTVHHLAAAMEATLPLAFDAQTRERCRQHARQWTWQALGPRLDELQALALHPTSRLRQVTSLGRSAA
ncbi:MAG TPA: glycosyltransferase family 4 protein [Chloroflexota bacterium]|nr:glycosyltransferase family 4 protein [Chloroflexota bacterium]